MHAPRGLDGFDVAGQSAGARCDRPRDERVGSSAKTSTRTVVRPSSARLPNPALAGRGRKNGAPPISSPTTLPRFQSSAARSTATGPVAQLPAERRAEMGASFGLGRIGEPADTAGLVAFPASDDAGFITGRVIYNTGASDRPIGRAS